MHPYKSRKYFSKNLAAVDNSSSSSSTAVMGFSGNSGMEFEHIMFVYPCHVVGKLDRI